MDIDVVLETNTLIFSIFYRRSFKNKICKASSRHRRKYRRFFLKNMAPFRVLSDDPDIGLILGPLLELNFF